MAALACPACGAGGAAHERFCAACGSPLVHAAAAALPDDDDARRRARKVHPPYADGEPVRVARAANQPEAELLQGLLLEAGIPSLARRSGGFDVPDFLAAGPRDVLVPIGGAAAAREVLGTHAPSPSPSSSEDPERRPAPGWVRAMAAALAVLVVALVAVGVIAAVLR